MKKVTIAFFIAFACYAQAAHAQWVATRHDRVPVSAAVAGRSGQDKILVARVVHRGNTYITRFLSSWGGAATPEQNREIYKSDFEVYAAGVRWEFAGSGQVPSNAAIGWVAEGRTFYVARVNYNGSVYPGWTERGQTVAYFLYNGNVLSNGSFEIMINTDVAAAAPAGNTGRPQVVVAPDSPARNQARGDMTKGGLTIGFIDERRNRLNGRDISVQIQVKNTATNAVVRNLELSNDDGTISFTDLPPGNYVATFRAGYEEYSGGRESFSTFIEMKVTPNPLTFTVKGGVVAAATVSVTSIK